MLDLRPSEYAHHSPPAIREACDTIWKEINPPAEPLSASYVHLVDLPWVEPRVICAAAAVARPPREKTKPRFEYPEDVMSGVQRFFVSAMLGVVAGPSAGDRIDSWLWWDMPSDLGHEIFLGEAREAVRDMIRRHGWVHDGGVRFGALHRKVGSTWGQRSSRGAPVRSSSPLVFAASEKAGKAPYNV